MKIQYTSDLHLEFPLNQQYVLSGGLKPEGEILVLAGDIVNLLELSRYDYFWDWCQENFKQTVVVLGNHDYYGNWPNLEDMINKCLSLLNAISPSRSKTTQQIPLLFFYKYDPNTDCFVCEHHNLRSC